MPSLPPSRAICGSARYSWGSVPIDAEFTYGGLLMIKSYFLAGTLAYRSDSIRVTRSCSLYVSTLRLATASASAEMSTASTLALGKASAIMMDRQPEPVHSSRMFSTASGSATHGEKYSGISSAMKERGTITRSST